MLFLLYVMAKIRFDVKKRTHSSFLSPANSQSIFSFREHQHQQQSKKDEDSKNHRRTGSVDRDTSSPTPKMTSTTNRIFGGDCNFQCLPNGNCEY